MYWATDFLDFCLGPIICPLSHVCNFFLTQTKGILHIHKKLSEVRPAQEIRRGLYGLTCRLSGEFKL